MIKFDSPRDWFKTAGLRIFFFQLFVFIFCLPPFHMGTWIQIEPTMLVIYSLACFSSVWMALGFAKKWLVLEFPAHPLCYILLAWAGWQIIATVFAPNPYHSWMGAAQLGEGAGFHVVLVLTTFFVMPLFNELVYRKKILLAALLSVCIMGFLHFDMRMIHDPLTGTDKAYHFYHENNPLAPSNWPHYLAFIAGWLWIAYASSPSLRTPLRTAAGVIIFTAVILVSNNKSAYVLMFPLFAVGLIVLFLIKKNILKDFLESYKFWKILAVIGILAPLGWIPLSQYYNMGETSYAFKNAKEHVKNCKPEYMLLCKHVDITERAGFNVAVIAALKDEPQSLLFGRGWGSFANDMFKYGMMDGLYSFKDGKFAPNYENLYGLTTNNYDFHPHDQYIAALESLGITGFLLFLAIPILAIIYLDAALFWWCVPALIGINAVASLWFFVPQVMTFQALGLAALCAGMKVRDARSQVAQRSLALIPLFIAALACFSVNLQGQAIMYGMTFWQLKFAKVTPKPAPTIEWMKPDIMVGGDRLVFYSISYLKELNEHLANGTATVNDRDWYRDLLAAAHVMATMPNANAFDRVLEPMLSMKLLFTFKDRSVLDELKPQVRGSIVASIIRFSEAAPQREDFIQPFLVNLKEFTAGDVAKQRDILEQILAVAPEHRSAL